MERDMDLARTILLEIKKRSRDFGTVKLDLDGYSPELVNYHVKMLKQAELIEASSLAIGNEPTIWKPISVTWAGHEFLDAAQDESIWNQGKKIVTEKGGGLVFEALKAVLVELAKSAALGRLT